MNFSAVVATDLNGAIGLNGQLIYPISEDLKHFKKITSGHTVILGRKTLETFPRKRPLPNRRNLILTHHTDFSCEGAEIFHSIEQVISAVKNDDEVFVIGGASVYQQFEPLLKRIYLTRILTAFESADTFFCVDGVTTQKASENWKQIDASEIFTDPQGMSYQFIVFEKSR
ncbi:MAG: dihydrofolate reductase [Butyricicoccus pullicaecorum]|nr:dihydrofolate reductase [Butyricicoccus pullicaecorum]MDO4669389.1 dihydrofolate reductase [Butyricicoccus pullicaecorum]